MVLYPGMLHVSRSLRRSLRRRNFQVSVNQSFEAVIRHVRHRAGRRRHLAGRR